MKITIESTEYEPPYAVKATVEVPSDDLLIEDVVGLMDQVIRGYGFYLKGHLELMED